ncbi:phosphoribosylaminoimidazolesuccinocarboxamide synthase [Actinocrispum sp. NPDC049592]|uniref:phosphoribosylaminoimidazolesuccinocarboxamide synthase n=1 Tax=Actinocrispum sp. NPDC049592 TaxID=3154835 RepID=UPI003434F4F1
MPTLTEYPQVAAGKVRELYAVDDDHLLLVASDRISAYDYVLPTTIPDKGRVLTAMSVFWFELLGGRNHLVSWDDPRIPESVRGRALVVRRLEMLPVECVARGYLTGSGLIDYRKTGSVSGVVLPPGLVEASQLPEPIFTPSTKAEVGQHDEAIDFDTVVSLVGAEVAAQLRDATISVYTRAAEHALSRGMILADTKFEFGLDADGEIVLADEVLTPDSSRYWAVDGYSEGVVQPAFDKQLVRDWLTSPVSGWDRSSGAEPPALPVDVVERTRARYIEAYERVSGRSFADWL